MSDKILFCVMDFWNAGAERMAFELNKYLENENSDITIFSCRDLNQSDVFTDYYYEKHLKLKRTNIYFASQFNKKIFKKNVNLTSITNFFKNYTKIFFFGEYVFNHIDENILALDFLEEKNIFIQCLRFQGEYYRAMNKKYNYNFILGVTDQKKIEYEFEGFKNYKVYHFPLSLDFSEMQTNVLISDEKVFKIAIISRIDYDKPMEVYLFAFNLLLSKIKNVELHFFGSGDIKKSVFSKYLEYLDLSGSVFSHGHTNDIKTSLIQNNIDIVWYQSYSGLPSGFSALDVISFGFPQVFWDFDFSISKEMLSKSNFPCFKELDDFVNYTVRLLNEFDFRKAEVIKQQETLKSNHDININIHNIYSLLN